MESYSTNNSISKLKGEQGGEDEATKTVHMVRLEAEDEANAVIVLIWKWKDGAIRNRPGL
jgi:hypothetical protein